MPRIHRFGLSRRIGTKIPDGSFKLEAGDVLHVIGAPEALKEAEHLLTTGAYPRPDLSDFWAEKRPSIILLRQLLMMFVGIGSEK